MQKWEYIIGYWSCFDTVESNAFDYNLLKKEFSSTNEMLDFAGELGWELISTESKIDTHLSSFGETQSIEFYFKRPKP